jgi:hypothetical protein
MPDDSPLTDRQLVALRLVAAGAVIRDRDWHVLGELADVLGRLEERQVPLIDWAGPGPTSRFGRVNLTEAGRQALAAAAEESTP